MRKISRFIDSLHQIVQQDGLIFLKIFSNFRCVVFSVFVPTANWSRDGGSPSSGRDDSDPRYAVGIPDKTENGSVSVSPKNASQGDRVTVTAEPDEGYELDSLKVLDKNGKELELTDKGDGRFTFIMPAGRVEVKAAFTEEAKISPFRDVPTDAYYYEAVKWAQKKEHHRRHRRRPVWSQSALHPGPDRHLPVAGGGGSSGELRHGSNGRSQ